MSKPRFRPTSGAGAALLALVAITSAGCQLDVPGPALGLLGYPVPISPYFQDKQEDRFWEQERYRRVPILGPITSGGPPVALDPPTEDEIMRALERARPVEGGLPFLHEVQRNDVNIVIEPICDTVDPPRVYPLIGPAQLHHAHYKCTIYFTEVTWVGWPIPYRAKDEEASEVIYVDHDHFHLVGNVSDEPGGNY